MSLAQVDLKIAADLLDEAQGVVDGALGRLAALGGADANQTLAYDLAHAASAVATGRASLAYGERGEVEARLVVAFVALAFSDLQSRVTGRENLWSVADDWFAPFLPFVRDYRDPQFLASLAETPGERHLDEDFTMVADLFHRFAEEQVRPHAEHVHRTNGDIPASIIAGLSELGGFGLSVPEAYGGFATGGESEYLGMVVATEELSWGGLGIGGSLITRPEIVTRALVNGGTAEQKATWLPKLASAEVLAAIAVTEPDYGSDVAGLTTTATRTAGGWLINGTKTWCTFAARADVLLLLARTDPDRSKAHRGLSLFLVEKPQGDSHGFLFHQDASSENRADPNGRLEGRPIDTLGYRGMHSYELSFDNWFVPEANQIGGEAGLGRGFYLQMAGFENGRIQTAARAVGLMQAAYEAALEYARNRVVFGEPIIDYELTRVKLGTMAAIIQCSRQFSLEVARLMGRGGGTTEASMAKAYVCRAAEWVTREAMQIHGGMGYAEEYPVSRYFVDARVLSIFEGADETLCLKVVAKRLLDELAH
ncbi:MAG: acyl-CoA/acyl-ACP dehydrogenase [Acidobacteriota bacterium]|nr:acyl-CoA/acyl-ACP dehydrogenase [Acidobacteriota bacterium]MDE3044569.1 acyl-CoA/acyl-ACP dehydrogenase [Acidobacteriota bacterium]MDE3107839.1 acyl-CoA/acyl-ACP dehydrogenase [Acidobacteriota bacterium]